MEIRLPQQAADLSYWQIVVPRGFEPRTLLLLAVRSNQLSYRTSETSVLFFIFGCRQRLGLGLRGASDVGQNYMCSMLLVATQLLLPIGKLDRALRA